MEHVKIKDDISQEQYAFENICKSFTKLNGKIDNICSSKTLILDVITVILFSKANWAAPWGVTHFKILFSNSMRLFPKCIRQRRKILKVNPVSDPNLKRIPR